MESTSQIMLDYSLEKLATATAEKGIEFARGLGETEGDTINLESLIKFIETATPFSIIN
jgi:hypothetical protein